MFKGKKIAFIGAGAMGGSILKGMLNTKLVQPKQIVVSDPGAGVIEKVKREFKVEGTENNATAVAAADVVILAVKPQTLPKVMPVINGSIPPNSLVISILAGTPIQTLVEGLTHTAVVRSMPNTPAQVGEGMTVWTCTSQVSPQQKAQARAILGSYGVELYVDQEKYLDMSTAINGSGPAYVFLFLEAMIDAGVHVGLPRHIAETLVIQTVFGSTKYAIESDSHLAELRNQVTSPGGTTAAALAEFEAGRLRHVVAQGVWGAYNRSVELGQS